MKRFASLLTTVLLAASACGTTDTEPEPKAKNEARYTMDRRDVLAQASYSTQSGGASTGADDLLYIRLQNRASSTEVLEVIYTKAPNAAESTYRPLALRLTDNQGFTSQYTTNLAMTISKDANGYSGTFRGERTLPSSTGGGSSQISNGVFTNVQ